MIKKIILIFSIFLLLGACYAVDIHDYKLPDHYRVETGNWASNGDFALNISEYNESDYEPFFTNNTDNQVVVKNNISNYTSYSGTGAVEVVEINGEKYIVESYITGNYRSKISECYNNLIEFNKLNNLKPVAP